MAPLLRLTSQTDATKQWNDKSNTNRANKSSKALETTTDSCFANSKSNTRNKAITAHILELKSNAFTIGCEGSTSIMEDDKKTFTFSEILLNSSSAVTAGLYGDYDVDGLAKILAQDTKVWKVRVS
jgi:hypothetical protein